MNSWIRRGAVTLTVLVASASAAFVTFAEIGARKLERRVDVAVAPVAYRDAAAAIGRGRYLFFSRRRVLARHHHHRPDVGRDAKVMPFVSLKEMSELDVSPLYVHSRSLPSSS